MNPPSPTQGDDVPSVAGVRFRPALTLLLYVLLVASAAAALGVQSGTLNASAEARAAAPWAFLAFAVGFGAYRLALASVKKYSAGKAFFQVGVTAIFCMVLFLSAQTRQLAPGAPVDDLAAALSHQNPTIRAFAAELVRYRPQGAQHGKLLVKLLGDHDDAVRAAAHESLVALNGGVDLGPAGDPQAIAKWGEIFK
jgi:hypothetical protein